MRQWHLSLLQNRNLKTWHSSPSIFSTVQNTLWNPLLESPTAAPSSFPEFHWRSEISSLSKVILVLVKARSHRVPNLGCSRAEPPGWFDVLTKYSAWDMMHERACCCDEAANHHLPIEGSGLLNHLNSFHGEMFKLNAKFDADLLLYSLSHFGCDGRTVHMLTHWRLLPPLTSIVKSSLFICAHSSSSALSTK